MSEWADRHRDEVVAEAARPQEIENLLRVAARDLEDAAAPASLDARFVLAYQACLTIARAALRAHGYRLRSSAHHYLAIESLAHTLGLGSEQTERLQVLRARRATAEYEMVGVVTDADLHEARRSAEQLRRALMAWIRKEKPGLLP